MDTQNQIERLIELAIVQRTELKELVAQLPQLREHLNAEVEKVFEETEPQLRSELEEWTTKQTADKTAALGAALEAKIAQLAKGLEISTQARYNAIIAEREENARLAGQAEQKIAEHAASLPGTVKEIVTAELSRFPRAGEIDQLRKEFAEPRGLNPRGKWQGGEVYNKLDLVTINGDSFVSNLDDNRERPSRNAANWTLSAARGNSGGGGGITSLNDVLNAPTAGQIIGSENGQYVAKTLAAGANITINETASTITIIGDEGEISLQDGTAAAPALFFTNDTDTGIYRPAANTLGISVSGTQSAYFDTNGLTVAGTATVGGNLTVNGDGVQQLGANGALVKLGVPTYAPNTNLGGNLLQIKSAAGFAYLTIGNGDGANSTAYVGGASSFLLFGRVTDAGVLTENARFPNSGNLLIGGTTDISGTGGLKVFGTTASTTTSSGALVVSGGVGVAGKVNAGSFGTTGTTLSAVDSVSVSTTAVDLAVATTVGGLYFVTGYNNSGGAQGSFLLLVRGSAVTTVSSDNNTGLTVTFSVSSGKLRAATASGTLIASAFAVTRG